MRLPMAAGVSPTSLVFSGSKPSCAILASSRPWMYGAPGELKKRLRMMR